MALKQIDRPVRKYLVKILTTMEVGVMKNLIVTACCAAILAGISVASAQTTGPQGLQTMKQNDPMNANARMKKKKMKKGMMKQDGMSGGMNNGMSGGMSGGGMSQGGMSKQGGMSGGGMTK